MATAFLLATTEASLSLRWGASKCMISRECPNWSTYSILSNSCSTNVVLRCPASERKKAQGFGTALDGCVGVLPGAGCTAY